ncbi:hypothetical protein AZ22_0698 [Bordetella bronchiseptica 980-2]|nr:hypothetical protein AZ22_0698 [Bordetella bronchiseptica 980-2]
MTSGAGAAALACWTVVDLGCRWSNLGHRHRRRSTGPH